MTIALTGQKKIDWLRPSGCPDGFETLQVLAGRGDDGGLTLEVAVSKWSKKDLPNRDQLARLHNLRVNRRATPVVLLVELDGGLTMIFGPNSASAPVGPLPTDQTERVVQAALDEPTMLAARARLVGLIQSIDSTSMPGIKNSGLFANHELRVGVPQRGDWQKSCETSTPMLSQKGPQLIEKLGFTIGRAGAHAMLLTGKGPRPEAIAVMLDEREAFDADSSRFAISPVAYGLKMADQQGVPWLIMLRGTQLRLCPARIEFGVGRKGLAETFFEVDLPQLTKENAGYIDLIFSAKALADGGTTYEILKSSTQYAVALGERLRDKVFEDIIPELSVAVADTLIEQDYAMDAKGLDLAYQLTLLVFFRMLFQVYAEDRKLLPYGENTKYDRNAIKTVAKDLAENPEQEFDAESTSLWDDLAQVWRVIDSGDKAWGVPAYNGGLFASDPEMNEHGAILKGIRITNDVMGPVLYALLLDDDGEGGKGPVDFRSLSVREFGTIYEGLLESSLGLAEVDLTLDNNNNWIPATKKSDEIWAAVGSVYFHNTSGQRKGTGSYFTPSFVVEHLLERALDPTLDAHLAVVATFIKKGDQAGAAEKFFDFRVADLAMGSGHFLTAAIDHIEQKMAAFLVEEGQFIPGVAAELLKLEQAALGALGPDAPKPERSSLLRRQIARRCIYGLDINPIAVELARVSIWIHTFVRGLPMSSLDHNLVSANSLTGIGSVDEALDVLVPGRKGKMTLFDAPIEDALNRARIVLVDAAVIAEINREETRAASRAVKKAQIEAEQAKLLFDAAVLTRIGRGGLIAATDPHDIAKLAVQEEAQKVIVPLKPGHMPALFPEVFLRDNGGFDVLVGNPPWEGLHIREDKWWGLRIPGLRGLPQKQRDTKIALMKKRRPDLHAEFESEVDAVDSQRRVLAAGPFEGLGSGHIDLYQAFAWRNWQLLREGGAMGIVLPRSALNGSGTQVWRREICNKGSFSNVVLVTNTRGWVFGDIEQRYTIAFVVASKSHESERVRFVGSFQSYAEFESGRDDLVEVSTAEFLSWTGTAAFPMLPDAETGEIIKRMKQSPRFDLVQDDWEFRPMRGDINDKKLFEFDSEKQGRRIPIFAGATFNLWDPNFGEPYAYAPPERYRRELLSKIETSMRSTRSVYYGIAAPMTNMLPIDRPRIAVRWITRPTDTRTSILCLLPPGVGTTDAASVLVRRQGDELTEAFLLGVMSSIVFDWYVRRWVELNLTFEILNPCPVPRSVVTDSRRRRIVEIAGRRAASDERFGSWAKLVGVPIGSVKSPDEQSELDAELDALVAHLYDLSRNQVEHIFKTFHRGWDYSPRLAQVLAFYDKLPKVKQ
jgi:hypothetical protein